MKLRNPFKPRPAKPRERPRTNYEMGLTTGGRPLRESLLADVWFTNGVIMEALPEGSPLHKYLGEFNDRIERIVAELAERMAAEGWAEMHD